jgi:uncharacterized protein YcfL
MKNIILVCASLFLIGCASKEPSPYTAPSVVAVKTGIERLKPHISSSEGNAVIKDLVAAVDTYEAQVNQQSKDLAKAQNDAVYWKDKQRKSLKELWSWRVFFGLQLLAVATWLAIKMKF